MILRFIIIILLTLFSIAIYETNKYLEIKNYYIQNEINKYNKLTNELKQIEKINLKIKTLNIPLYSKQQAQNIVLNKIDLLLKSLPVRVKEYQVENNKITAKLFLDTEITNKKEKREVIEIFKTFIPVTEIIFFYLQHNNIRMNFIFTLPYKEENGNK